MKTTAAEMQTTTAAEKTKVKKVESKLENFIEVPNFPGYQINLETWDLANKYWEFQKPYVYPAKSEWAKWKLERYTLSRKGLKPKYILKNTLLANVLFNVNSDQSKFTERMRHDHLTA